MLKLLASGRNRPILLASLLVVVLTPPATSAEPEDWLRGVSERIRASEYHFVAGEDGVWSAPCRAHGLRSFVSPEEGWRLVPRSGEGGGSWELSLRLVGVGRGDGLLEPGPARGSANGNRVELSRSMLTEWYVNEPRGVEQGFTIPERIGGSDDPSLPLVLEMEVGGDVAGRLTSAGEVAFLSPAGDEVVRYAKLIVRDATERTLPSRFEMPASSRLRIVVEDAGATYPVEVDPLATGADWIGDSDQLNAEYGLSVSTAGDVNADGYADVIVGADEYDNVEISEGRVYVYYGSDLGLPELPSWIAESNLQGADFGISVGSAGDVNGDGYDDIIVGANRFQHDFCFANANIECFKNEDCLGTCVALCALNSAVTCPGGNADCDGKCYEQGTTNACVTQPCECDIDPSVSCTGDADCDFRDCGPSMACNNDLSVVCTTDLECDFDLCRTPGEGAAFVYHGSPTGLDAEGARPEGSWDNADWMVEGNQSGANFAVNVARAGDVNGDGFDDVIVGADEWNNGHTDEGAAFVYLGSAIGLSTTPVWSDEPNLVDTDYGFAVGPAGDINSDGYDDILVGAWNWDNLKLDEGRVFLYLGSPSGPVKPPHWVAEAEKNDSHFGKSVWTAGDVNGDGFDDFMIGADEWNDPIQDEGGVFVYYGAAEGIPRYCSVTAAQVCEVDSDCPGGEFCRLGNPLQADWNATSNEFESDFAFVVRPAGDVNADGYDDIIVGAPDWDDAGRCNADHAVPCDDDDDCLVGDFCEFGDEGAAFLYIGSAKGLSDRPAWVETEINQTLAQFGRGVFGAGDVNGDGFDDVIVGADEYDSGILDEGSAFVYLSCAVSPVTHAPELQVEHSAGDRDRALLSWNPLADRYSIIRGDLGTLRSTGGDFEQATEQCLKKDQDPENIEYTGTPTSGQFWWFLVRVFNQCTGGGKLGTYDTASPSQLRWRDPWIRTSPNTCPNS